MQGLLDVLAPDVALIADGGGIARRCWCRSTAARRSLGCCSRGSPGRDPPARRSDRCGSTARPRAKIDIDGVLDTAISMVVEDGRITHIYAIRNPEKLTRLDAEAALSR